MKFNVSIPDALGGKRLVAFVDTKELPSGTPLPFTTYAHRVFPGVYAEVQFATADRVWFDRVDTNRRRFQVVGRFNNLGMVYRTRFYRSEVYRNRQYWTVERFRKFFGDIPVSGVFF